MSEEEGRPGIWFMVLWAAKQAGDRTLQEIARRELREKYGIEVTFKRDKKL